MLANSVTYTNMSTGATVANTYGVTLGSNGNPVGGSIQPNSLPGMVVNAPYIDVNIDPPSTHTPVATVDMVDARQRGEPACQSHAGQRRCAVDDRERHSVGQRHDGTLLLLPPDTTFTPQQYNVSIAAERLQRFQLGNAEQYRESTSFTVVTPTAQIVDPFSANSGAVDVNTINQEVDATSGEHYVDVIYMPSPGASLNYKSILAPSSPVVTLSVNGAPVTLATYRFRSPCRRIPSAVSSRCWPPAMRATDANLNTELADQNVTEFRYLITMPHYTFPTGTATVIVNSNWTDTAGEHAAGRRPDVHDQRPHRDPCQPGRRRDGRRLDDEPARLSPGRLQPGRRGTRSTRVRSRPAM